MPEPEDVQAYQVADAEQMLRSLRPAPCQVDRNRFFFEAGRIRAESRIAAAAGSNSAVSPWAFASAAMLLVSLSLAAALGWSLRPNWTNDPAAIEAEQYADSAPHDAGSAPHDVVISSRARLMQEGGAGASVKQLKEQLQSQDRINPERPDGPVVSDAESPTTERPGG